MKKGMVMLNFFQARRKFINIGREMLKDDNLLDNCNSSAEGSQDDRLDVLRGKIQVCIFSITMTATALISLQYRGVLWLEMGF